MAKKRRKLSRFKKMTNKLQRQGRSKASAKKIAAAIGRRKYGAKGMAKKAAAGRRAAARRRRR